MNRKGEREMTINLNGRSHDRQGAAKKEAKQINKTKQTASRHAFLRGITVNDALLFSLPRAPDSALIYDVECAPAIFIKRVCSRWITQMPGHERYRRRGVRVRGVGGSEGTVMWHPAVKLSSAGHITIYEAFLLSPFSSPSLLLLSYGPSDSHFVKNLLKVTSLFQRVSGFFFYLECCAYNCHFGGSLFGVSRWCIWSFFFF